MATDRFSIDEAIRFGWNTMKANFGFFFGITIIILAGQFFDFLVRDPFHIINKTDMAFLFNPLYYLYIFVILPAIHIGLIKISLKFCDNEKGKFSDFFSALHLFFKYLAGTILYGLICLGGTILLIVPGIIWAIKFQYYCYFIVDKGLGPIKALEASSELTEGIKWDLFLFGLLLFCIDLLGFLCLVVGLFATIPTTKIAYASVYRKLESQLQIDQTSIRDIARNR
jgi:uncharacterized membrane protein